MSDSTQNLTNIFPFNNTKNPETNDAVIPTAIIYCEGQFGKIDGKTANGLVRHSHNYRILSVIDSKTAGLNSGEVLDEEKNNIPILTNMEAALTHAGTIPDYFIFGIAPSSGLLSDTEKTIILDAMSLKMNIVNGLHEFLSEDPIFLAASIKHNVTILDIRKPKNKEELQTFNGEIHDVKCPRIAILGTDCAIGKRTTATILANALRKKGLNVIMIATGQTGIIQGAPYGVALDAVPSQFCAGELEAIIVKAYKQENPDLIIIEGQGSLSHPAFSTSSFILRGSCPTSVILQHAPKRVYRADFPKALMPTVASEINLIETFADTKVIGLTLNHEDMSSQEIQGAIDDFATQLRIPVTDALSQPTDHLVQIVSSAYPHLERKMMLTS